VNRVRDVLLAGHLRGDYPGATAAIARDGAPRPAVAVGWALRYADAQPRDGLPGGLVPEPVPAGPDTVYDLASLTKLFTTVVVLQLVERGRLGLDRPVGRWLPELTGPAAAATLRQLLTHTAGYPAGHPPAREARDPDTARRLLMSTPLVAAPGTAYRYSDIGPILAGFAAERASGASLDRLVADGITGPLGMADTGYRPGPAALGRVAATEAGTNGGGCLRGRVHDGTAAALGGVAGHAGLFGTAGDLVRFGEALRGGPGTGAGLLAAESIAELTRDQLPRELALPGCRQGLGARLGAPAFMGPLAEPPVPGTPVAYGHTGFTGTSLVVDPARRLTVVLLTNRVHPSRSWSSVDGTRRALATALAAGDPPG
jgi:CubicO group peptidase (beta-lactamase class C family)